MRRTKIICTIGPKTCRYEQLEKLASMGMNVARLNMSHGDQPWHAKIIRAVRTINEKGKYSVAVLLDTKGPEVRSGDLKKEIHLKQGDTFAFTVKRLPEYPPGMTEVSYDGFINDVKIGDTILIDGGILKFTVREKTATDVVCDVLTTGILTSRRHVNILGNTGRGPSITKKDWEDIDFGIKEGVDFIALSFVKDAASITKLKAYLKKKDASIDVVAKIESKIALENLESIITASDGVMIARGDLGAEIPLEEVPLVQEEIVEMCRKLNRPVIIATHLLESMIINPTPTRAEVTDITEAVKERVDAVMLSGETASGQYPFEAISVMSRVAMRIEEKLMENKKVSVEITGDVKEQIATSASIMANNIEASAILVITRRGYMATLLSQRRPNCRIFALTNMSTVRRKLNLYWGITSFRIEFSSDPEKTIQRAIETLKNRNLVETDQTVVVVSDILAGLADAKAMAGKKEFVETIQVRKIK